MVWARGQHHRQRVAPDLILLISTLGGLALFGAVGLIIGPVIAGLFIAIWEIFHDTFGGAGNDSSIASSVATPVQEQVGLSS